MCRSMQRGKDGYVEKSGGWEARGKGQEEEGMRGKGHPSCNFMKLKPARLVDAGTWKM